MKTLVCRLCIHSSGGYASVLEREPHTNARHIEGVFIFSVKLYDITMSNSCELNESLHWGNCRSEADLPDKESEEPTLKARCEKDNMRVRLDIDCMLICSSSMASSSQNRELSYFKE